MAGHEGTYRSRRSSRLALAANICEHLGTMSETSEDTWASSGPDAPSGDAEADATLASRPAGGGRVAFDPGSAIDRYLILARLGAGGMGVVYAAYDPELDRKVAIKLLLPSDRADEAGRARLLREAQALAKLAHPNVVGVHDVGTVGDRVFIAMEYVEGETLSRWSKARARSWREVLEVMLEVGRGVAAAHAAGLLHRDLKPDNVMVGVDGRVRVMDFGLARREGEPVEPGRTVDEPGSVLSLQLTRSGALLGTPAYMAPEQFEGRPATASSDQFSLCVTFWEALYGQRPFAGRSIAEVMTSVLAGELVPPPRGGRVPRWLQLALATGLARDPSKRFASVEALLATLIRGEGRARARRVGVVIAVLALGVGSVHVANRHDQGRRIDACTAAGERINEVWNAESRAALRAGLLAVELPYAATVADKVTPWIDAQAGRFRAAATQACMNASVHASWDAATLARANFCLDDRRLELATLVRELSAADATVVMQAVQAASGLSPIATCIHASSLAGMPDPPEESMREQVGEIRADLSRARTLESAGKIAEGLELARAVRERAEALDWPPLLAAALTREASALYTSGAYAEAEQVGIAAYLAAQRSQSWDLAAETGFGLVATTGRQGRNSEARVWLELAAVAQEFAGDPLELGAAERLLLLATLDQQSKQYERAVESFEQARTIYEQTLGPDHPRVALTLNNLANAYWGQGQLDRAQALHEQALGVRERALGATHPNVAQSLFNLGFIHDEQGHREQAWAHYERALAIQEAALGPDHPDLADTLINLGNALQRRGEFAQSKPYYERALVLQETVLGPDHLALALVIDNFGIAHQQLGELEEARRLFERALSIRTSALAAEDPQLAFSQRNLAEVQFAGGDYQQALAGFERTLAILQGAYGPDDPRLVEPTVRLGQTLAKLGRHQDALALLERALAMHDSDAEPEQIAVSRFALATVLWDAPASAGGDRPRARALAEQALEGYRGVEGWELELAEVEAWLTAQGD